MASGRNKEFLNRGNFSPRNGIKILDRRSDNSMETRKLIEFVFNVPSAIASGCDERLSVNLKTLPTYIDIALANEHHACEHQEPVVAGRLGPDQVVLNPTGSCGVVVVEPDRLGVWSQSNFCTIRCNTCVYSGKWQYEALLGSKGIMQIGWCTLDCKFSPEDGVGDTDNSYAFDGSRVRKWNSKLHTAYGESWLTGDVIGVTIDCDAGKVSFMRNGRSLGDAFTDVVLGRGIAYFPAVSLSMNENVRLNFGGTPLRYPADGYRPLQDPPVVDLASGRVLISSLERVIALQHDYLPTLPLDVSSTNQRQWLARHEITAAISHRTTLVLLAAHIWKYLGPLMMKIYVIEECMLPLLLKKTPDQGYIHQTLDSVWSLLQEHELRLFMEHLLICLLDRYRYSPIDSEFNAQKTHLELLRNILNHQQTRDYLMKNILFDKIVFPMFMFVKLPDISLLKTWLPVVWWSPKVDDGGSGATEVPPLGSDDNNDRQAMFTASKQRLCDRLHELETLQIDVMSILLTQPMLETVRQDGKSSGLVFTAKFRHFLKDHFMSSHIRLHQLNKCPLMVQCYFFYRLLRAVRQRWSIMSAEDVVYVPHQQFYNETTDYWDLPRLGGLVSYLRKTYKSELESSAVEVGDGSVLYELLDGIVLLYNMAAHKQLGKTLSARETCQESISALSETQRKLTRCPAEMTAVRDELENAHRVFMEKAVERNRFMAWVNANIYSQARVDDLKWLLRCILKTLRVASDNAGQLYAFVPEFYAEACVNLYNALTTYFSPSLLSDQSPGNRELLIEYSTFVCMSFCDTRIIGADVREVLIQALGCLVLQPVSVNALESIPVECRLELTKTLLTVYENRPWAQTNWIIVKLWKGCGFAYRYTQLPHMDSSKSNVQDIGTAGLQKPCPSIVYQHHIRDMLRRDIDGATKLIDSMLNQLNWAFSEFIRMLQELEQLVVQPTGLRHSFIDERQLKICATCFDISVGLLRVLEMVLSLTPELFLSWPSTNAELLLRRFLQMLAQVLVRVTGRSNTFDKVSTLRLPGLESVDHFPILAAVAGVLVQLLNESNELSRQQVLSAIVAEPGFQSSSLDFLLGISDPSGFVGATASAAPSGDSKPFSLTNYKEVSPEELRQVEHAFALIRKQLEHTSTQEVAEEMLCNICYAEVKSVKFMPCRHQSCRSCITHQMMSRNECFFCKAKIDDIVDL